MPVDNRNFIIEDLPDDDPEDFISPEDDADDDDEVKPQNPVFRPQPHWQNPPTTSPTVFPSPPRPQAPWLGGMTFQQSPRTVYTPPTQQFSQQRGYAQTNQNSIPRRKKIIFCDLIDVLIESESAVRESTTSQGYLSGSNNFKRTGIMPRGLYDIRLKTEVWGKFAAFGADYVFCVTNQPEKSEEELRTWKVMTDYVMYSLADYLNIPHQNCKCLTKIGFDRSSKDVKPGAGLLKKALQTLPIGYKYCRKDLVVIGMNSGYQNQPDIDRRMAERIKIDYIDVNDLLTIYY